MNQQSVKVKDVFCDYAQGFRMLDAILFGISRMSSSSSCLFPSYFSLKFNICTWCQISINPCTVTEKYICLTIKYCIKIIHIKIPLYVESYI